MQEKTSRQGRALQQFGKKCDSLGWPIALELMVKTEREEAPALGAGASESASGHGIPEDRKDVLVVLSGGPTEVRVELAAA